VPQRLSVPLSSRPEDLPALAKLRPSRSLSPFLVDSSYTFSESWLGKRPEKLNSLRHQVLKCSPIYHRPHDWVLSDCTMSNSDKGVPRNITEGSREDLMRFRRRLPLLALPPGWPCVIPTLPCHVVVDPMRAPDQMKAPIAGFLQSFIRCVCFFLFFFVQVLLLPWLRIDAHLCQWE
jgi:hypothetical protein